MQQSIASDPVFSQCTRFGLHHAQHGSLRWSIVHLLGSAEVCADRGDAYDAAPVALFYHLSGGRLCRPEASFNVGMDVSIERVFVEPAITLDRVIR